MLKNTKWTTCLFSIHSKADFIVKLHSMRHLNYELFSYRTSEKFFVCVICARLKFFMFNIESIWWIDSPRSSSSANRGWSIDRMERQHSADTHTHTHRFDAAKVFRIIAQYRVALNDFHVVLAAPAVEIQFESVGNVIRNMHTFIV